MKLVGVRIKNYKSFGETNNFLFVDNLNAIVGKNESGKSNIIDAISEINCIGYTKKEYFKKNNRNTSDKVSIELEFAPYENETLIYPFNENIKVIIIDEETYNISENFGKFIITHKNYLKIFNEYFKNFDEYNRLLLNTKIELHPADGVESVFCPINFDNVDMFYGNAYENITSHIELLVLINNVIEGRDYDKFLDSSVTINKYRKKFTKESKKGPLKSNRTFNNFTLHFDSKIRNASHHRWFYVDDSSPERLMYKSGGTGTLNYITYIDYIYKCNQMALSLASLIMIEIYLMEQ